MHLYIYIYIYIYTHTHICHDNSRRDWHGNVHDNVNIFGLGGIDLHTAAAAFTRLATANISTTCCCEHVRNTAAANITNEITPYSSGSQTFYTKYHLRKYLAFQVPPL